MAEAHKHFLADPAAIALNSAHSLAFHRGLGNPLYPSTHLSSSQYLHVEEIEAYAAAAYSKPNFALVGSGIEQAELTKWVGEFFKDVKSLAPSGLPALESPTAKYYGGEERIAHGKGSSVVIAFPGSSLENGTAYKPEIEILAALLGGQSTVKWSTGNSLLAKVAATHTGASIKTDTSKYSDGGLLTVTINGSSKAVAAAAKDVAKTLRSVLDGGIVKEDVKKAIAQAKFKVADSTSVVSSTLDLIGLNVITNGKVPSSEEALKGINEVTEEKVKQVRIHLNPYNHS
jgi:ubiquinol-cytochrome c reductase core subunit 2